MLSAEQVQRAIAGPATPVETVAAGTTAGYSTVVIPPHTVVAVQATLAAATAPNTVYVRLCREFIYGAEIGRNPAAPFEEFFASDDDAAVAAAGLTNAWSKSGFVNQPVLIRAGVAADGELKIFQDEQDGVLRFHCANGARGGKIVRAKLVALEALRFVITHDDDDAGEVLQYQIRELRRSASDQTKYWNGSAWTTNESWQDVTGSATIATFSEVDITADEASGGADGAYDVALRSKADYPAGFSRVTNIGLHQRVTTSVHDALISTFGGPAFLYSPYWSRVGVLGDAASIVASVSRMG